MSHHLYFIDGNNVIGKMTELQRLQASNKQRTREILAGMVDSYFRSKKHIVVTIFFDGHPREGVNVSHIQIKYSENKTADDLIKQSIDHSKNPKLITVVSSDNSVAGYARKSSCTVLLAEDFVKQLNTDKLEDEEEKRISSMQNDVEEFERLFGVKK